MRLKLVLITSLLGALIGSGISVAIILVVFSSLNPPAAPGLLALATLAPPLLAVLLASVFVYRHTARRRKLQALLTAILVTVVSLAVFVIASIITARRNVIRPPQPAGPTAKR
jgi:uncharacterized membrane-anchored protein